MQKKIVVVGGVAGGASCIARLRRQDEFADIVLFERGKYVSYANCGLPYYIGGEIAKRSSLILKTVDGLEERFDLDIHNQTEVLSIDREKKQVHVKNLKSGKEWDEPYDKLVLSPGAAPLRPPITGIDEAEHVYTLRNIPDTDIIQDRIKAGAKHATIIGGGFIGLEMAENLVHAGLKVTLVEMADQVMAPIDPEMAAEVHIELRQKGVELILSDGIDAFEDKGATIVLKSGKRLNTDMTILSIGVRPENQLAKDAGLEIGERGGIVVNDELITSDPDIYAIGDAIEVRDFVQGTPAQIPLAGPANRQGRMVANHISGRGDTYAGTLGSSVAKVFDLSVAATGNNEKTLKRLGRPYQAIHLYPSSHASYYPGSSPISLKVLYNPEDGALYGAQAVGRENIDKTIDTIATAIYAGLSVYDLANLELCYAPAHSSAKSPVNFAGYIAENIRDGMKTVGWDEIDKLVEEGAYILDIGVEPEHDSGHLPTAINIPLHELRYRLDELPKDKTIYTHCSVGLRGYIAARILQQRGYDVVNVDGGLRTYRMYKTQDDVVPIELPTPQPATEETKPAEAAKADTAKTVTPTGNTVEIDCCGLQCPGPMVQVSRSMDDLADGDKLTVSVSDPGFLRDITAWCRTTGNQLLESRQDGKNFVVDLMKGQDAVPDQGVHVNETEDALTLIVFSGDFDKVMAAFVIANGAAAMGKKVTMFFTFWGLNALRKPVKVKKDGMEKLFGMMMPEGASKLGLSKMNMGGLGTKMMRRIMRNKNVSSIEELIFEARKAGVVFIACSMSMDVMGIRQEELLDGVEIGGVGTYLGEAGSAGTNLFI